MNEGEAEAQRTLPHTNATRDLRLGRAPGPNGAAAQRPARQEPVSEHRGTTETNPRTGVAGGGRDRPITARPRPPTCSLAPRPVAAEPPAQDAKPGFHRRTAGHTHRPRTAVRRAAAGPRHTPRPSEREVTQPRLTGRRKWAAGRSGRRSERAGAPRSTCPPILRPQPLIRPVSLDCDLHKRCPAVPGFCKTGRRVRRWPPPSLRWAGLREAQVCRIPSLRVGVADADRCSGHLSDSRTVSGPCWKRAKKVPLVFTREPGGPL